MFRRHGSQDLKREAELLTHASRLHAIGDLLDREGFVADGICILASGTGYIVTGYVLVTDRLDVAKAQRTLEITEEMLREATLQRLAAERETKR